MNELKVEGYFYFKTNKTNVEDAIDEFQNVCKSVGINADNISFGIIRDENGNDITYEGEY